MRNKWKMNNTYYTALAARTSHRTAPATMLVLYPPHEIPVTPIRSASTPGCFRRACARSRCGALHFAHRDPRHPIQPAFAAKPTMFRCFSAAPGTPQSIRQLNHPAARKIFLRLDGLHKLNSIVSEFYELAAFHALI